MSNVRIYERIITLSGPINDENTLDVIHGLVTMNAYDDEIIKLIINSPGGNLDDGIAVFDCLRSLNSQVHGIVYGQASSAASIVLQGCDKRIVTKHAVLMFHDGEVGVPSIHPKEARRQLQGQKGLSDMMHRIMSEASGTPLKQIKKQMLFGRTYFGQGIISAGFADSMLLTKGKQ